MDSESWTENITPKKSVSIYNLRELFNYKDLISLFVKRDFVTLYKQTILGPFWYVITPIVQTVICTMMFGYRLFDRLVLAVAKSYW